MRYLIFDPPQPEYDTMTFDYDKDRALVARWSKLADAKDADLSKFRKSGGKLIMTYGWADQILQPLQGVRYYESVVAKHGKDTADFARLFMVPGMAHCGGGIGPDRNDAVTAVIDWVEKGKAPDQLIASKVTNGQRSARARSARIRRSRATRARAASTTRRTSAASRRNRNIDGHGRQRVPVHAIAFTRLRRRFPSCRQTSRLYR